MTVNIGVVHAYLEMAINFQIKGQVQISMYNYINKTRDNLPQGIIGNKPTAVAENIFNTDGQHAKKLDKDTKYLFHHLTAKNTYIGKRRRPDI